MTAFVDAHVHPPLTEFLRGPLEPFLEGLAAGHGYDAAVMTPEAFAGYYRDRGARAVVCGWDAQWTTNRRPFGNGAISDLVAAAPDVFIGLGAVDPLKGAAAVGLVHEAARLGLAGIAVHPQAQGFSPADRTTNPVWEAAAEHDLICMFHTGTTIFGAGTPGGGGLRLGRGRPLHVDSIAARFPAMKVVLVHGGRLWLDEALAVATHKANVFVCVGGQSPDSLGDDALDALRGRLADRMIFGSGFPFAEPEAWIEKWSNQGVSAELTRKLLNDNATRLFAAEDDVSPG